MPVTPKPTINQAIMTLYASLGSGLPTLWLDEVPEGQGYPRAVLNDGGRQPISQSYGLNPDGTETPADVAGSFKIKFSVEDDSDVAEALALTIMQAFTPLSLQWTYDPNVVMFRGNDVTRGTGERSPADKPVYETEIDYSLQLHPTY